MKNRLESKSTIALFLALSLLIFIARNSIAGEKAGDITNPPLYLVYDVTYAGGHIAEVDFSQSRPYSYKGQTVTELECRVESSGLFDLNGLYRSIVKDDYSVLFLSSDEGKPGNKRIIEYYFDYSKHSATVIDKRVSGTDTTSATSVINDINQKYFDTVSMIFRIKQGVDTLKAPSYIPVFIEGRQDSILIESVSEVQAEGPDGDSVAAYWVKARLPRPPYPGFGDRVEIYISKDEDRIPLRGRIEMALGYLEINLRPR